MNLPITKFIITSLFAGFAVLFIATVFNRDSKWQRFRTLFLARKKLFNFSLLLLVLFISTIFFLSGGTWLSPSVAATYVRELVLSILVIPFMWVAWNVVENRKYVRRVIAIRFLSIFLKVNRSEMQLGMPASIKDSYSVIVFFANNYNQLISTCGENLIGALLVISQIVKINSSEYCAVLRDDESMGLFAFIKSNVSDALTQEQRQFNDYEKIEEDIISQVVRD